MGVRPRIKNESRGAAVEKDPMEFTKNRSTENARKILTIAEIIQFDIWFDQHYYHRERHGDEDGKREGIEPEIVKRLIVNAAKHLLFFSIKVKDFTFVNFTQGIRNPRITLTQKINTEDDLNIVVEFHYLAINKYEVTLITAMRKNNFYFSDGQFQLIIETKEHSILNKKSRNNIIQVDSYTE